MSLLLRRFIVESSILAARNGNCGGLELLLKIYAIAGSVVVELVAIGVVVIEL